MSQYRSPGVPPSRDCSPCPETRILVPFSIPAGIDTSISLLTPTSPPPLHEAQGDVIFCPSPPQAGQVVWSMKKPALRATDPRPPQVGQADFEVPGFAPDPLQLPHRSCRCSSIVFFIPSAASLKSSSNSTRRLAPRCGPRRPPRLTPKKSPKGDSEPPPKMSPNASKMSWKLALWKSRCAWPRRPSLPYWS